MASQEMETVTFDTNVFPAEDLTQRAARVGIAVGVISVSLREAAGSTLEQEIAALHTVLEAGVYEESKWDRV